MSRGVSPMTTVRSRGQSPARARAIGGSRSRSSASEPNAALPLREPVADPRPRELEPRDPLEVAGDEREAERVGPCRQPREQPRPCPGATRGGEIGRAQLVVQRAARGDDVVGARVDRRPARGPRPRAGRGRSPRRCGPPPRPDGRRARASRARRSAPAASRRRAPPRHAAAACRRCPRAAGAAASPLERHAGLEPPRERRDQPRRVLHVVHLDHLDGRVHVAQRDRDDAAGDAAARRVDRVRVGARRAASSPSR